MLCVLVVVTCLVALLESSSASLGLHQRLGVSSSSQQQSFTPRKLFPEQAHRHLQNATAPPGGPITNCESFGCDPDTGVCPVDGIDCTCVDDEAGPTVTCVEVCQYCDQQVETNCVTGTFAESYLADGDFVLSGVEECYTHTAISEGNQGTVCISADVADPANSTCALTATGFDCECGTLFCPDGGFDFEFQCTSNDDASVVVIGSGCEGYDYVPESLFYILNNDNDWLYGENPVCIALDAEAPPAFDCAALGCVGDCDPDQFFGNVCTCEDTDDGPSLSCAEPCQYCDALDPNNCVRAYFTEMYSDRGEFVLTGVNTCYEHTDLSKRDGAVCLVADGLVTDEPTCDINADGYECECMAVTCEDGFSTFDFQCTSSTDEPDVVGLGCEGFEFPEESIFYVYNFENDWLYGSDLFCIDLEATEIPVMPTGAPTPFVEQVTMSPTVEGTRENQNCAALGCASGECPDRNGNPCTCVDDDAGTTLTCTELCTYCDEQDPPVCVQVSFGGTYTETSEITSECYAHTAVSAMEGTTCIGIIVSTEGNTCDFLATGYDCSCELINCEAGGGGFNAQCTNDSETVDANSCTGLDFGTDSFFYLLSDANDWLYGEDVVCRDLEGNVVTAAPTVPLTDAPSPPPVAPAPTDEPVTAPSGEPMETTMPVEEPVSGPPVEMVTFPPVEEPVAEPSEPPVESPVAPIAPEQPVRPPVAEPTDAPTTSGGSVASAVHGLVVAALAVWMVL